MEDLMTLVVPKEMPPRKEPVPAACEVCDRATVAIYDDLEQELLNAGWQLGVLPGKPESFNLGWICTTCQVSL